MITSKTTRFFNNNNTIFAATANPSAGWTLLYLKGTFRKKFRLYFGFVVISHSKALGKGDGRNGRLLGAVVAGNHNGPSDTYFFIKKGGYEGAKFTPFFYKKNACGGTLTSAPLTAASAGKCKKKCVWL